MGFSTPKPKFDLAEFLSQKGTPRTRRPSWKRMTGKSATPAPADAAHGDVTPEDGTGLPDAE